MIKSGYEEGLYREEGLSIPTQELDAQIRALLRENHGVGILGGYFEPGLPLCIVSELTVQMLGYSDAAELQAATGNCMAGLVCEEDYDEAHLRSLSGVCPLHLRAKDGNALWVHLLKRDLTGSGRPMWLASVCDKDALYRASAEILLGMEVISAISRTLWRIYLIDLEKGLYTQITTDGALHRFSEAAGVAAERFPAVCEQTVAAEYRAQMLAFLDISTLADRLCQRDELSQEYRTVSGNWHVGRLIVQKRDGCGRATRVLYTIQIINDQKVQEREYEERLARMAEQAQRASLSKTDFLRRMSHDIRTPINGIRGMIEIANLCEDNREKQRECREKIWEASGYLLSLVSSVLDMNKLESGAVVLEERPFDLPEMLHEVNTVGEMQAVEHGLSYIIDERKNRIDHPRLIGSPVHLKQVLLNLASNAVKYNRAGGSVTVWTREHPGDGDTALFEFHCKDTGIGMSPEFQARAFEPFSQEGRDEARTHYDGSGLGLSIVKGLVEQMGGTIGFESTEGVGTAFCVTLPLRIDRSEPVPAAGASSELIELSGACVLLVEDNALNAEITQFFLERQHVRVICAHNGQEAVDCFRASAPGEIDAVLMDIMMPILNGHDAARAIRAMERPDAKTIPIFAMTANAFLDDIQKSYDAGMNEHLTKPLDPQTVIGTHARYIRR